MNIHKLSFHSRFTALALTAFVGVMLAISGQSRADDVTINLFNTASEVSIWHFDYGSANIANTLVFSTNDAKGSAASGSMKITVGYGVSFQQAAFTANLPSPTNGSVFTGLEFDVKVDPASALDKFGNALYFQFVIRNGSGFSYTKQFEGNVTTVSTNNGWRHVIFSPLLGTFDDIRAITLDLYDNNYTNAGTAVIYVDNLKFIKPTSTTDVIVSQFNDDTSLARWRFDYGGVTNLIEFDATQDANTNSASGSLKVTFGFDAASLSGSGNNKGAVTFDLPAALDGSSYQSMEMDVKIAPGSVADASGNSGFFQMVIRNTGSYSFNSQFGGNVSTNTGWRHIRVSPVSGAANDIRAITLELFGGAALTGPVTFYVDNLKFTAGVAPPPAPRLGMEVPMRGLNLIPTSGQYQRQNLATINNSGLTWVGSANPVTYSVTIGAYPDASHSGFQTHIFLVAGTTIGNAPDYSEPNVVFLDIQSQANGSALGYFRYKINEPAGNTFLYSTGTLGNVTNATPIGTWSMTFRQNTNVTVITPGGATNQFTLPAAAAALFADPLTVYVGDQPNTGANVGQTAVLSRFQIRNGGTTLLDDNFLADQDLDTAIWQVAAGDANGVLLVGSDAAFWLSWTTPDSGFGLQSAPTLGTSAWIDLVWTVPQMGSVKRILVRYPSNTPDPNKTYAPDPKQSYFRLLKP